MLEIERLEEARPALQRFGLAEHQEALALGGEGVIREDAALRRRLEVHERIARDQQVDPRDRRVLQQVVATEDDGPPDVVAEEKPTVVLMEEALAKLGAQALELLGRVD